MPSLALAHRYLDCGAGNVYSNGGCYSVWDAFVRWIVLGGAVFIVVMICLCCLRRYRRRRVVILGTPAPAPNMNTNANNTAINLHFNNAGGFPPQQGVPYMQTTGVQSVYPPGPQPVYGPGMESHTSSYGPPPYNPSQSPPGVYPPPGVYAPPKGPGF